MPKRLLIFYQYFSTRRGAWGTRYYEFGKRWAERGYHVTVVTTVYDKSDLKPNAPVTRTRVDGIDVIALNLELSNKHGPLRRWATFAASSIISTYFALTEPADIVIASSGPLTAGIPGLVAHTALGRPFVFEARDLWPRGSVELGQLTHPAAIALGELLERACYRAAHTVVALSPAMQPHIERVAPGTRSVCIPNAADLDVFSPDIEIPPSIRAFCNDKFVVLYAGTLGRANFGDELLNVAKRVQLESPNVLFAIVGDGYEGPWLRKRAERERIDNVRFLGLLPKLEVAAWHAAASLVTIGFKPLPVLESSSPNKLFDALAAGKPILNNTPGWIADLLATNDCGHTYPHGDVDEAARFILNLCKDPARRERLGRNARALAVREFSRDLLSERYERVFESVGRRGP